MHTSGDFGVFGAPWGLCTAPRLHDSAAPCLLRDFEIFPGFSKYVSPASSANSISPFVDSPLNFAIHVRGKSASDESCFARCASYIFIAMSFSESTDVGYGNVSRVARKSALGHREIVMPGLRGGERLIHLTLSHGHSIGLRTV